MSNTIRLLPFGTPPTLHVIPHPCCLAALFLSLVFATVAFGSSITTNTQSSVQALWSLPPGGGVGYDPGGSYRPVPCTNTGIASSTCASSYNLNLTDNAGQSHNFTAQASATASASYGRLSTSAVTGPIDDLPSFRGGALAFARAEMYDTITIFSDSPFPASGWLSITWSEDRSSSQGPVGVDYDSLVPWTSGVPVTFHASVSLDSECGFVAIFPLVPSCSLGNDLVLQSISVMEGGFNPIPNFFYSVESGTAYNVTAGTAIPEASPGAFIGLGLAAILLARLGRRHAS